MKKFVLGILAFMWLGGCVIFAQSNILPDSAEIWVKNTIMEGEATNLSVTMMKNGSKMTNYAGTIYFTIEQEDWSALKSNEYTLPNWAIYTFLDTDLWSKEFQKWLEIKKEWTFYIQVEDLNDPDEKILWRTPITVIKNAAPAANYHVDVFSPINDASITNEKVDILAGIPELPNSKALIYLDNNEAITADIDSAWIINYSIWSIDIGKHTLKIEVPDMEWNILWSSDIIPFNVVQGSSSWIKDITVYPENWLMVGDKTKVTVFTDEMVESVRIDLSDRPESLIMSKDGLGEFSYNLYLISTWEIEISVETATANNSTIQNYPNIKQINVIETPEIANVTILQDEEQQLATVSWEVLNWDPVSWYLVKYRATDSDVSGEEETENTSFIFREIPFDTEFNINITPIRKNALWLPTHWSASKTIQFIIRKPGSPEVTTWDVSTSLELDSHKCSVQNIATHTTKIWNNYYLIWDKVENVSKYIVYSSSLPDGSDKVKVYETSDNSYEYPFDYESEEDKFMYFWIVWICDDGEELELTWATKVQVWPAENFFLLLCLTFLIYFWIKLFRETE